MSRIVDNADEFLREYDQIAPKRQFHVLAIENVMLYAIYLHNMTGYFVIDEDKAAQIIADVLDPVVNSSAPLSDRDLERLLTKAADLIVEDLQRFTGGLKPPVEHGRRNRPTHSGAWANITTELVSNFYTRVNRLALKQHPNPGQPPEVADPSKYPRFKRAPTI